MELRLSAACFDVNEVDYEYFKDNDSGAASRGCEVLDGY